MTRAKRLAIANVLQAGALLYVGFRVLGWQPPYGAIALGALVLIEVFWLVLVRLRVTPPPRSTLAFTTGIVCGLLLGATSSTLFDYADSERWRIQIGTVRTAYPDEVTALLVGTLGYVIAYSRYGTRISTFALVGYAIGLPTAILAVSPATHVPASTYAGHLVCVALLLVIVSGPRYARLYRPSIARMASLTGAAIYSATQVSVRHALSGGLAATIALVGTAFGAELVGATKWSRLLGATALTIYVVALAVFYMSSPEDRDSLKKPEIALGVIPALALLMFGAYHAASSSWTPPILIDRLTPTRIYAGVSEFVKDGTASGEMGALFEGALLSKDATGRVVFTLGARQNRDQVVIRRIILDVLETKTMHLYEFPTQPSAAGPSSISALTLDLNADLRPWKYRYVLYDLASSPEPAFVLGNSQDIARVRVALSSPEGYGYRLQLRFEWYSPGSADSTEQNVSRDSWALFPTRTSYNELVKQLVGQPILWMQTADLGDVLGGIVPVMDTPSHLSVIILGQDALSGDAFGSMLGSRRYARFRLAEDGGDHDPYMLLSSTQLLVKRPYPDPDWQELYRLLGQTAMAPMKVDYLRDRRAIADYQHRFEARWSASSDVVFMDAANEGLQLPLTIVPLPRVPHRYYVGPNLRFEVAESSPIAGDIAGDLFAITEGEQPSFDESSQVAGAPNKARLRLGQKVRVTYYQSRYELQLLKTDARDSTVAISVRPVR